MPTTHVLLITSGDLWSLVALANLMTGPGRPKVQLLHPADEAANLAKRRAAINQFVQHYKLAEPWELSVHHREALRTMPGASADHQTGTGVLASLKKHKHEAPALPVLPHTLLLVQVMALAMTRDIHQVHWPIALNADYPAMSKLTEQIVLATQLADLEVGDKDMLPAMQTPLLEMTDAQIVELGEQLGVPMELAWHCDLGNDQPCKVCPSCRRRRQAFMTLGLPDPQQMSPLATATR